MPVGLPNAAGHVVAADISDTALQRAAAAAEARGLGDRIEFAQHDLSDSFPDGTFDLMSAQFLHSMIPLDRPRVLGTPRAPSARAGCC